MATNGWTKIFRNGTIEDGGDHLVQQGKASWSRGCLTDIKTVELEVNRWLFSISGTTGNWHQSDDFVSLITDPKPVRIKRRVQYSISDLDSQFWISIKEKTIFISTDSTQVDLAHRGFVLSHSNLYIPLPRVIKTMPHILTLEVPENHPEDWTLFFAGELI